MMRVLTQRRRMERDVPVEALRYDDVEARLRTGDIFIFHGESPPARIVERFTRSEYSHIGMVVRPDPGQAPRIWQSVPKDLGQELRANGTSGARADDLRHSMAVLTRPKFGNTPFLRSLLVARDAGFEERARQAVAEWEGAPFPSPLELVADWVLGLLGVVTRDRSKDCAELVALTWQRIGLLPRKPPANAYSPQDFSVRHQRLRLAPDATLGPPAKILLGAGG